MNKNINISRDITNGVFGNPNIKFMKRDKWSPNEIKLFLNLIYQLQEKESLNLTLGPRDLYPSLSHNNHFEYLSKILNGIKAKNFFMKIDDSTYRNYSLFSYLEYNGAREKIGVQFNKDMKDQLFNMKSFSRVDLDEIMQLNSYFAIRSRLLLSSFDNRKDFILDIERFKTLFQIPESYKNSHIENKVFALIIKECAEVESVYFKKSGRKATHVIFKYDFKNLKKQVSMPVAHTIPLELQGAIDKAKKNRFIQEAWTVKAEKRLIEILESEGEAKVKKILSIAYTSLVTPIRSTLTAYLNKVLAELDEENEEVPPVAKVVEVIPVLTEELEVIQGQEVIETPELLEEAKKLYREEIGVLRLTNIQEKAFSYVKKQFLIKASELLKG